ncbi:MAG: DUF1178 family protein [Pseudomonadota bacterium]|nr:DUF1178 family protein [Pseudomonadota bacterium]
MVVYDLICDCAHPFEGWFASLEVFEAQQVKGLVSCPTCSSTVILRRPAAPRLNLSRHSVGATRSVALMPDLSPQAMWRKVVAYIRKHSDDVGTAFPEEARKIHYGEAAVRNIRGQASAQDVAALSDEGIEVTPIPNLPPLPDKLQ